jgi:hypothetical protein
MIWADPGALAALALVVLPVLVHLLVRRHAARVRFPAMRFVPHVRAAAVRLRAPSDATLLLLRIAIVAAAALAAAQPILITAGRQRAWDARVARAIIVDTSPSVATEVAARLADQAATGVFLSRRFASSDLRDAIHRATEWLATTSAAGRDIAIISDFQRGSLDEADLAGVPASTGIDVLRAGLPTPVASAGAIEGWRGGRWNAALTLDGLATRVTWTRAGESISAGLTVQAAANERAAAERAADAARSFGVPAIERSRPVEIDFAGATTRADAPPVTPWIASAAIALLASPLLDGTSVMVHVGERGGIMTVKTTLPAASPFAPALIRAALLAAAPHVIDREAETASIDDSTLRQMVRHRTAGPSAPPPGDVHDSRWLWVAGLALLVVEDVVRRRRAAVREQAHAHAA